MQYICTTHFTQLYTTVYTLHAGDVMCIGGIFEVRTTGVQVNMSGFSAIQSMSSTLFTLKIWLAKKKLCALNGADHVVAWWCPAVNDVFLLSLLCLAISLG